MDLDDDDDESEESDDQVVYESVGNAAEDAAVAAMFSGITPELNIQPTEEENEESDTEVPSLNSITPLGVEADDSDEAKEPLIFTPITRKN
jgi:hypothetical protein